MNSPYKSEAPWDDFEFGWHVVDAAANVVILTMAWHTHHDTSLFSRRPQEPDLETLVYWVQRLEPLLSAKQEDEVIVIFCNRTGSEGDLMYVGTSAVLGIKRGEVFVYGLLGRGVKELLVVDTSRPPVSKLTSTAEVPVSSPKFDNASHCDSMFDPMETPGMTGRHTGVHGVERMSSVDGSELSAYSTSPSAAFSPISPGGSRLFSPTESIEHQWPLSPHGMEAVLEEPTSPARLQFLARPYPGEQPSIDRALMGGSSQGQFSPGYPDPTHGTEPRHRALPKLSIPTTSWRFHRKGSPFQMNPGGPLPQVLTGRVAMTPMTAFEIESAWESPRLPQRQPVNWPTGLRQHTDIAPKPQVRPRRYRSVYSPESPKAFVYQRDEDQVQRTVKGQSAPKLTKAEAKRPEKKEAQKLTMQGLERLNEEEEMKQIEEEQELPKEEEASLVNEPISLNAIVASVNQTHEQAQATPSDEVDEDKDPRLDGKARADSLDELSAVLECLRIAERRPGSAFDEHQAPDPSQSPNPGRPFSPKSRNASRQASRTRLFPIHASDSVLADGASSVLSSASIPISLSPSIFDTEEPQPMSLAAAARGLSTDRPTSRMGHRPGSIPGGRRRRSLDLINERSRSLPGAKEIPRSKMRASSTAGQDGGGGGGEGRRPRSLLRFSMSHSPEPEETTGAPETPSETRQPRSQHPLHPPRAVSRGRQPGARGTSVERSSSVGEKRSDVSRRRTSRRMPSYGPEPPTISAEQMLIDPRHLPGGEDEIIAVITLPRDPSRVRVPGKRNPYDITLQPFAAAAGGLRRALAVAGGSEVSGGLVSATSSASTFGESVGPVTPANVGGRLTPSLVATTPSLMGFDEGDGVARVAREVKVREETLGDNTRLFEEEMTGRLIDY